MGALQIFCDDDDDDDDGGGVMQGRFRCIAKNVAGQAVSECTLTVKSAGKPAAAQPGAVVPADQQPKEVTHTIQMEDVQRDTLEVEEQKTVTDREVKQFHGSLCCLLVVVKKPYVNKYKAI